MSTLLVTSRQRRAVRRAVRTRCEAVAMFGFRPVGHRVLDLSTRGLLLACDQEVQLGESVVLTFEAPGGEMWIDAEAEVARRVDGFRLWDPGYCAGLRFTRMDGRSRGHLLASLVGLPPPVPNRHVRVDYAETVRRIAVGIA